MVSAYSIYPELSPRLSRVTFSLCLSFLFSTSSVIKAEVASHSRLGFVAIISSSFLSAFSMRWKSSEKWRSPTNTPFIGEIAHHSTWYTPVYHPAFSRVSISRYSSTTHIWEWLRVGVSHIEQISFPASVIAKHVLQVAIFSLILFIFSLKSLR